MDATERALVGTAFLLLVVAVLLMTSYYIPPDPPPGVLPLPTRAIAASMPGSLMLPEQDFVAAVALEDLARRR